MPKPHRIVQRPFDPHIFEQAQALGLSELQARLVAQRLQDPQLLDAVVNPKLKNLQHPSELKNADHAAQLIADAIQSDGLIVLTTDYDTDGVTSAWVAYNALTEYFGVDTSRLVHFIGERKEGYGITDDVCERILALQQQQPIALVISADQGSSDEPRIQRLAQAGIAVCVTDHHQMPIEGAPMSAVCTVNPQQADCAYDKTIAGCFVIFLVMTQVRRELIQRGYLTQQAPSLKNLTMHVALGTIADSVSLKSPNNRAMVLAGLQLINQFQHPAWQAMKQLNDNQGRPFNAEYLAFQVATRINAASRVSDVRTAFDFLCADNIHQATQCLAQLDADNSERREQQQAMLDQAIQLAQTLYHPQRFSLAFVMEGNAGIQGIIASRVGEKFGLPCVAMTRLDDGTIAGSGRGIVPEIDLRLAFQTMEDQHPGLFISMGGHKGAAGCQIPGQHIDVFIELFEQAVKKQLGETAPVPIIETDGTLPGNWLNTDLINQLDALEPYGREWPQPQFYGQFNLIEVRQVGQSKLHLSMTLQPQDSQQTLKAIFFNALDEADKPLPYQPGDVLACVYQPSLNQYMGRSSLQLRLQWARKAD
ncbi:MAG: DHH family phosphoesterase [Thiomicrospira sp.]|nr:DHH family phosphoesterase [Thiomicrospira sp.]